MLCVCRYVSDRLSQNPAKAGSTNSTGECSNSLDRERYGIDNVVWPVNGDNDPVSTLILIVPRRCQHCPALNTSRHVNRVQRTSLTSPMTGKISDARSSLLSSEGGLGRTKAIMATPRRRYHYGCWKCGFFPWLWSMIFPCFDRLII